MLNIIVPEVELFNELTNEFVTIPPKKLSLEHSLVSLYKWESKWKKPFLQKTPEKTYEETLDYIRCMTITQNVDETTYNCLTKKNIAAINSYITDPMTATKLPESSNPSREVLTAEVIYYAMTAYNIPFECQKWHLNKLLTLINVCGIKTSPKKKLSRSEVASRNKDINAIRRAKYNTKG